MQNFIPIGYLGHKLCVNVVSRYLGIRCISYTLHWRHNGRDSVSNHQPRDCLLDRLFRRRSKKTSQLHATGLCVENVSFWWRHHADVLYCTSSPQCWGITGCACTFPHHRIQWKPLVSDHGVHHDTHVPWCMSGSLSRGGAENVPGIPGALTTRKFTYLVRSPFVRLCQR